MPNDFAADSQASEADLPEAWRDHVRTLRQENARRRNENQELRAQVAALTLRAETAHTDSTGRSEREAARIERTAQRLKELEVQRLAREALRDAAAAATADAPPVDMARAQRLLERMPRLVDIDAEVTLDDEGHATLEAAAAERLKGLVGELAEMARTDPRVAAPPVGGEPPRPASPLAGPLVNAWDAAGQSSRIGKARAGLRQAAARNAALLDEIAGL